MEGHEKLGAQQAVAGLVGPHIQPLTLLKLAHTQVHHPPVHLQPTCTSAHRSILAPLHGRCISYGL